MTDEAALLAAVLANPDEDTPRLVYADWLSENGQPEQGEFIRVQCKLAELEKVKGRPTGGAELAGWLYGHHRESVVLDVFIDHEHGAECEYCLRNREGVLWDFMARLPREKGIRFVGIDPNYICEFHATPHGFYQRGFISRITCAWESWRDHAAAILARQPVRRVTLTTRPSSFGYTEATGDLMPLFKGYWPDIEFELPPPVITITRDAIINDRTGDIMRIAADAAVRHRERLLRNRDR